jgi:type VI secretion system protein ImpM
MAAGTPAGLYGKLPAHGDFVRRALPDSFVEPWDAWLQQGIAAARERLGDGFAAAWSAAPAWRFRLPAGACGPDAAAGVLLASEDMVGRRFPLTLAALLPDAWDAPDDGFYDALEAAGRDARDAGASADALLAQLPSARPAEAAAREGWWRMEGDAPVCWALPALPPAEQFVILVEGGA